jgi:hypothetical protein
MIRHFIKIFDRGVGDDFADSVREILEEYVAG